MPHEQKAAQQELEQKSARAAQKEREYAQALSQCASAKCSVDRIGAMVRDLQAQQRHSVQAEAVSVAQKQTVQQELQQQRAVTAELQSQVNSAELRVQQIDAELADSCRQHIQSAEALAQTKTQVQQLTQQLADAKRDNKQLKVAQHQQADVQMAEHTEQLMQLQSQLEQAQQQRSAAADTATELQHVNSLLQMQVDTAAAEAGAQYAESRRQQVQSAAALAQSRSQVQQLTQLLANAKRESQELKEVQHKQADKHQEQLKQLHSQLEQAQQQRFAATDTATELQQANDLLQTQVNARADIEAQLAQLQTAHSSLQNQHAAVQSSHASMSLASTALRQRITTAITEAAATLEALDSGPGVTPDAAMEQLRKELRGLQLKRHVAKTLEIELTSANRILQQGAAQDGVLTAAMAEKLDTMEVLAKQEHERRHVDCLQLTAHMWRLMQDSNTLDNESRLVQLEPEDLEDIIVTLWAAKNPAASSHVGSQPARPHHVTVRLCPATENANSQLISEELALAGAMPEPEAQILEQEQMQSVLQPADSHGQLSQQTTAEQQQLDAKTTRSHLAEGSAATLSQSHKKYAAVQQVQDLQQAQSSGAAMLQTGKGSEQAQPDTWSIKAEAGGLEQHKQHLEQTPQVCVSTPPS